MSAADGIWLNRGRSGDLLSRTREGTRGTEPIAKPNDTTQPGETVSKTDNATSLLRNRIIGLSLEPGCDIDEKRLLSELDVGRTPLREALNRLISEGLIESRGNRGLRVTPLTLTNTRELFEAYMLSERAVASVLVFSDPGLVDDLRSIEKRYEQRAGELDFLGVTSTNAEFHHRLATATQNRFVARNAWQLTNLARRISFFIFRDEYRRMDDAEHRNASLFDLATRQHLKIVQAIADRDRPTLVAEMTRHADYFRERLLHLLSRSPVTEADPKLARKA
ncbi:MAG: GntR family transcriptional regulator [Boseongicola sp.]|nr:GntR family transcriptional regulator [Boseongicola sp.]